MTNSINKVGSGPYLISSYTTQRNNSPVILELWGSENLVTKGVVKNLEGKQISEIPPSRIYKEEGQSITGPALLTYVKVTQLSPVLHTLGKKCIAWLVSSVDTDRSSGKETGDSDYNSETFVNLEAEKASLQKFLPSVFLEDVEQNHHTEKELDKFGAKLFDNGNLADQNARFPDAIEWFKKALFVHILLQDKKTVGACYGNIGTIYYSLGDYQKAIEYLEKRLQIASEIKDREGEGRANGNLGNVYDSIGEHKKAILYHERHLEITIETDDKVTEGSVYGNLGCAYSSLGEYQKTIQYHEKQLKIANDMENQAGEGLAYSGLGNAYHLLGSYQQAVSYHEKDLQIAKEIGDKVGEGTAYGNLGNSIHSLGEDRKAIQYYKKHLEIAQEVGNRAGEAAAYTGLGNAYDSLEEYHKAIQFFKKSLQIAKEIGHKAGEGIAYGNLGNAYLSLGEYRKAIQYHEQCLQIASEIGDRVSQAKTNHNLGFSFFKLQKYSKSEKALAQSIATYSKIQTDLGRDEWKISIFEEQSSAYRSLERNYFTTGNAERSLEICEKGRARSLFDIYCNRLGLSKKAQEVKENITFEQMRAIAEREKTSFIYFSKSLNNEVHVWIVKKDGMHSKKIELPEGFKTTALPTLGGDEPRRSFIGDYLPVRVDFSSFDFEDESEQSKEKEEQPDENAHLCEGLERCYQALIAPIEEWLDGKKLTIITDATMRDVPFAALYKNGPNGREYLIDKYTISMAPSLRIFDLLQEQKSQKDGSALIVADPAIKEKRLPGAKMEGETLARKIPNSKLLSEDTATAEAVKQAVSNTSILHFACHGSADARINRDSVFEGALCLTNGKGEKELLFADEIQKLDLKADLVVLSACQTGKGALRREGVIGLSRAFLGAGVPSVIATHWSVSDYVTQEIVSDFYTNLIDKKMAKAEALRQAMLTQRKAHPEKPEVWGAFFLIGK